MERPPTPQIPPDHVLDELRRRAKATKVRFIDPAQAHRVGAACMSHPGWMQGVLGRTPGTSRASRAGLTRHDQPALYEHELELLDLALQWESNAAD